MSIDFEKAAIIVGLIGSIGSILTGYYHFQESREKLELIFDDGVYGPYNKLYGPALLETPEFLYIFKTFLLINKRKKILITSFKVSIFNPWVQEWIPCEIIDDCPRKEDSSIFKASLPPEFPEGYKRISATQFREICPESASDCFLALRVKGFAIRNPEGIKIETWEEEYTEYTSLDMKIEIETAKGKHFDFKTKINTKDPATIDKSKTTEI